MNQLLKNPAVVLSLCLTFIFGICLIFLSVWMSPYHEAMAGMKSGNLDESLELFRKAENRFESFPVIKQFFPEAYEESVSNQFYILYTTERYDDLLEKSATSPLLADVHFWTGNTLFRRAGKLTDPQEQVAWLERASEEFLNMLKLEPDNWNAKFNFELTNRLIDELKEEKETPPQMLEILRPRPRPGEQPFRQTG